MTEPEITTQVLIDIRNELRQLSTKVDGLETTMNRRFDGVDRRFDEVGRQIDNSNQHLVATDARLSTEVSAVRGAAHDHEDKQSQLDDRVTQCEHEIDELKKKP